MGQNFEVIIIQIATVNSAAWSNEISINQKMYSKKIKVKTILHHTSICCTFTSLLTLSFYNSTNNSSTYNLLALFSTRRNCLSYSEISKIKGINCFATWKATCVSHGACYVQDKKVSPFFLVKYYKGCALYTCKYSNF